MPVPLVGNLRSIGITKETSWGTPVAPTLTDQFVPVENPKWEEMYDPVEDNNFRSRVSKVQGWQQGFRSSKYTFVTHCYPDVLGNLLMAMYGSDGWTAGSTHPFTVNNAGLPNSYTIEDFYGIAGVHTRAFAGMYIDSISIAGTDKGPMKATVSFAGGKFSTLVAKNTSTYTVALPFMPWQGVMTLNSVVKTNMLTWTLNLKRAVAAVPGFGAQDPANGNSTDFTCDGKMTFEPTDDTEYLLFNTSGQAPFPASIVFTSGANTLTHQMTSCQFVSPTTVDSGPFLKTAVSFLGIDNATDGGAAKTTIVGGRNGSAY